MKTFEDYIREDNMNLPVAIKKWNNRFYYSKLQYVMADSIAKEEQREIVNLITQRENMVQQNKKEQNAQRVAYEYARSLSKEELLTLHPDKEWDEIMEAARHAVNSAKEWIAIEEDLCRMQKTFEKLGL